MLIALLSAASMKWLSGRPDWMVINGRIIRARKSRGYYTGILNMLQCNTTTKKRAREEQSAAAAARLFTCMRSPCLMIALA